MRASETHAISCPTATLVVFDRHRLRHRHTQSEWFVRDEQLRAEVRAGSVIAVHAPMGGVYSVRATRSDLRAAERPHVVGELRARIDVEGGELLIGDLGCLPGATGRNTAAAVRLGLRNGSYEITLYALSIHDGLDRLPHLVVRLARLSADGASPRSRPKLIPELWCRSEPRRRRRRASTKADSGAALLHGELPFVVGVAVFDPARLEVMRRRPPGWTSDESELRRAHASGELALIRARGRGFRFADVRVHVDHVPPEVEGEARSRYTSRLVVASGAIAVAGAERIPDGRAARPPPAKWTARIEPGDYDLEIYVLPADRRRRCAAYALVLRPARGRARPESSLPCDVYG